MPINHIIFDWDGTLVKTLDVWLDAYRYAFSMHGHSYDDHTLVEEFFSNHETIPDRHPTLDFPTIAQDAFTYVKSTAHLAEVYDGAKTIANRLVAEGIDVTLVTSSGRAVLEAGLQDHNLTTSFQTNIAGDDGFGHKPDIGPFAEMLKRTGHTAEQTMIVGDSSVDILAGRAIGSQTCHFAPASNSKFYDFDVLRALGPDHQITALDHLLDLI